MYRKSGFTLAEVLITLAIIGVVAAMTIPTLISNVHDKVVACQIQVIQRKINQGTEGMQVRGALLENYSTTSAFVDELSKDMKIISKCDSDHLTDCWPYDKITINSPNGNESEVVVADQKEGSKTFQVAGDWGDVMGIILGNGTPMLLSYNKNCPAIDPDSTYEVDKSSGMSETSQCIAGVYDINGKRGPNKLYQDVVTFRANGYTKSYLFKTSEGKYFMGLPFVPTADQGKAVGKNGQCTQVLGGTYTATDNDPFGLAKGTPVSVETKGDKTGCAYEDDRWLAAAVQCGINGGRLPTIEELDEFASKIYKSSGREGCAYYLEGNCYYGGKNNTIEGLPSAIEEFFFDSTSDRIYTNKAFSKDVSYYWYFFGKYSSLYKDYYRTNVHIRSICVAD